MAKKARVGMIGLKGYGNIVRQGLKECETLELAAVWSRSRESIERSQRELPSKVCGSYEDLLKEDITAVLIINPNYLHVEYGVKAAEAGKAILVEKPMTNTVAEARELIDAFGRNDVLLAVKHLERYGPDKLKIKELIDTGRLGTVLSAEAYISHTSSKSFPPDRWKRDPKLCPAAPLTQLAVHHFDTAMSFFGKPVWAQSHHRNVLKLSENVDCTVTTIGFENVLLTVHAHYVVPTYYRFAVFGTEGVVVCDDAGLRYKAEGSREWERPKLDGDTSLVGVLNAFGRSLLHGDPFETDGDAGLQVVAMAEAAIRSAEKAGAKVTIAEVLA